MPNVCPAPRGEIPQPHRSSGSDHSRSHIGPSWGISSRGSCCTYECGTGRLPSSVVSYLNIGVDG
eukprot:scaffold27150_cov147-Isochrysis_galbana.AAC.3